MGSANAKGAQIGDKEYLSEYAVGND